MGVLCLALLLGAQPGCITAATVATISVVKEATTHTARVDLAVPPDQVYGAMMRIIDRDPAIKVKKNDPAKRQIQASKGKNKVTAEAKAVDGGHTLLIIKADADEKDINDLDLALQVEKKICDELGVKYRVGQGQR